MKEQSTLQGWLMKQKHGLCRTWTRRYFVLSGRQLYYYRHEELDHSPQNVIDLDYYSISTKKNVKRQCTFVLVADEHRMLPDYYLQAESEEQLEIWVNHLQQHMTTGSVLDKWLERLDINSQENPSSSLHTSQQQQQSSFMDSPPHLRSHRSVESIHTIGSVPSSSMMIPRSSFTNDRRPSYQSTHSNTSTTSHNSISTCTTINTSSSTTNTNTTIKHRSSNHNLKQNKLFSTRLFSKKNNSNNQLLLSSSSSSLLSSPTPIDVATISTPSLSTLATTNHPPPSMNPHQHPLTTSLDLDHYHHPVEFNPSPHHSFLKKEKVSRRISFHLDHLKNHHYKNHHLITSTSIDPTLSSSSSSSLMDKPYYYSSSESCSSTTSSSYQQQQQQQQPIVTPIIHPSEYNHDDDPEVRFKLRQQQQKEINLVLSQSVSTK
ncbi:unnamed protein product [Cunninghamella blakesleeana]